MITTLAIICVAIGGALGGIVRWLLKKYPGGYLGTFIANMAACALLGWASTKPTSSFLFVTLGTGIAGALSTWSTLAAELGQLWQHRKYPHLAGYLLASVVGGMGLALVGIHLS
ncbi:hypothetical protein GSS88_10395 [Corynebacterium sp. 3HC-13]|uniref:FluC/FEX family fluoride channel n=1 Tax=Corynebacterium poyangense TaxID=2684405 RepID=UPI001CCEDA05|nr:CrcB family protein [Corynebacterium poyangense]MBZ8178192.1 hypothetical protein [Corynebacterium poyangense]